MVICIVFSQVVVYVCLFVGTFPSYDVSRSNWFCIAQGESIPPPYHHQQQQKLLGLSFNEFFFVPNSSPAAFTYYFILCSFAWMSAMSYNIMSKFRYKKKTNHHACSHSVYYTYVPYAFQSFPGSPQVW